MVVRCYMWQFPPGTSLLLTPAPGKLWRVSSVDRGVTPAVGMKVPLGAPPAPLWTKTTTQQNSISRVFRDFTIFERTAAQL